MRARRASRRSWRSRTAAAARIRSATAASSSAWPRRRRTWLRRTTRLRGEGGPAMIRCNGVHHLAVSTADIKAQIAFFNDVLGMELVALYWMHGVEGAWHGFLKLNDHSYVAFVQTPEIAKLERVLGVTHSGSP